MFLAKDLRNVTMIQHTNTWGRSQVFWDATLCHSLGERLLMLRRTALPIVKGQAVPEQATGTTRPVPCHIPEHLNPQQEQRDNLKSSVLTI